MKILCIIDHFGSGGAQRQLVNLACALKSRGHQVEFFIYYPDHDFSRPLIREAGIRVHEVRKGRGFSLKVLWHLVRLQRRECYDAVVSFLNRPNTYAELARVLNPRPALIVSERASHHSDESLVGALVHRVLHRIADAVVANSHAHAAWLRRYAWLRQRAVTIYNGYPIPVNGDPHRQALPPLSLLVIGRIGPEKNGVRLIEALSLFHRRHGYVPPVSWVGQQDGRRTGVAYRQQMEALLERHPEVDARWSWLGERSDISELLERHYALVHASLHEGLPNVVCEALMAGRPALISNVCDHPLLVEDGERGFLFEPHDPQSIAAAIERLVALSGEEWLQLSANARRYAEANLGIDRMVSDYETLLTKAAKQYQKLNDASSGRRHNPSLGR
jgi:glycosyltransferase involved in cell wall biosynthesis